MEAEEKPKMKFRLKYGAHQDDTGTYNANDPRNNIIETSQDLVKICGPEKFERVDQYQTQQQVAAHAAPQNVTVDVLEDMTKDELLAYAESEEIELGHARNKADIIEAIRTHRASRV